ncbi:MAG: efflux RND transporter permease subunit [Gammaproteobacteria bacterium]|nr:efflux RND transporter permease subunit [Gammaproteobacteria bacterium]
MTVSLAQHSRAVLFAAVLLTVGGVFALSRLPVGLFPQIDYPRVIVSIDAGDRDAAQMAAQITRPIEIALRAVPGVSGIRSTTSRGAAEVALDFAWGDDMVAAALATEGALATILPDLPTGARFNVRRSDPSLFPVLGLALTSDSLDPAALRQLAEQRIRPALIATPGIAGVDVLGGAPREFAVDIDPARLQALGLSFTDVAASISRANSVRGAGRMEDRHRLYLVLLDNRVSTAAELAAIPVKAGTMGAGVVTLGQVASIRFAEQPLFTRVTSNGQSAVLLNIRQAIKGNSVAIVQEVNARLKEAGVPPTVTVTPFYDQTELVIGAAHAVRDAILLGALLAGLVLFLFLRSARLMLITGLMLPAVLAATCLILLALGMSFNMMTLGGMAAAVGLVVDDAVVMLEHMVRRMQEGRGETPGQRLAAAAEMGRPLIGSTAATVIVFLPLALISGVTGDFFKALAVTMVIALGISLAYSRLAIPLLAAWWLRPSDIAAAGRGAVLLDRIDRPYAWAGTRALRRPGRFVAVVGVVIAALGVFAWTRVPSGFMPHMDEGGFVLDYKAQPGAALADTDRLLTQVEAIVTATPEVASYSRRTGVQLGGGLTEADEGDFFIRLKDGARRPIDAVMADVRTKIETQVPGLQIELIQLMGDLIGDLTAVPQPIEVKLFVDNAAVLEASAKRVAAALNAIPGIVEVVDGLRVAGDAIRIHVRRADAAQQGLDPDAVARQLEGMIGGTVATEVQVGAQLIAVRLRTTADLRQRIAELGQLGLTAADGQAVRLGQIADIGVEAGQMQLRRENLAPFVGVTARLEGRDLGSAMGDVRRVVSGLGLPRTVRVEYGGLYAQQQRSFADLTLVFVAALLLVSLLLTLLFDNLGWTLAAVSTVLLSAAAVLTGLWITGMELNISALMGLTMVVGMVTELIIFFLAELDRTSPPDAARLREAGARRLRPILMSALIAILTLMPLALGSGRGAGLQQPLATAIIFGLTAAVPLILLFLPGMILVLQRRSHRGSMHAAPPDMGLSAS